MSKVTLDLKAIEDDFFAGNRLIALSAPAIPDYQLCWTLNRFLDMHFERQPEMDIRIAEKLKQNSGIGNLFAAIETGPEALNQIFSVYEHKIDAERSVFLYQNRIEGLRLIKEMESVDYFLLFPDNPLLLESDKLCRCHELSCVSWMKEIVISELKSRAVLIL